MSTTLTVNALKCNVSWDYENVLTLGNTVNNNQFTFSKTLANGTASAQADSLYITSTTIAASGTLNLDVNGALSDVFGNTINMLRVKVIYIELTNATSAASILVGNGTNPLINWITPSSGAVRVRNPGCLFLACTDSTGYAVTAETGDVLKILNEDGGNQATLNIAIIGASA